MASRRRFTCLAVETASRREGFGPCVRTHINTHVQVRNCLPDRTGLEYGAAVSPQKDIPDGTWNVPGAEPVSQRQGYGVESDRLWR